MAVQSNIEPEAGWFIGEAKTLSFTLLDGGPITVEWTFRWDLYDPDVNDLDDGPLLTKLSPAAIVAAGVDVVQVSIDAADTAADFEPIVYQYVLRRTDPGHESVLAYGSAALNDPRTA